MTRKPKSRARTDAKQRTAIEWIGATVSMPAKASQCAGHVVDIGLEDDAAFLEG